MTNEFQEAKESLLSYLKLDAQRTFPELEAMAAGESKFIRDMKFNLRATLESEHLSRKEAYLIALAVATNQNDQVLAEGFTKSAVENGASEKEIAEIHACTSLLSTNNVLYRFRHFASEKKYETMHARLKMTLMVNPVIGKEFFELVSLVVSAVNGCETCVNSHEQSLQNLGTSHDRIFDAIRLGAVVRGITAVIY